MYAAEIVEKGTVDQVFREPQHPYTWGLFGSLPLIHTDVDRLAQIPGQPPSLLQPPPACRFAPRCAHAMEVCTMRHPSLAPAKAGSGHLQACWLDQVTKDRQSANVLATITGGVT
jgi:oligopeptide/dipeptide ABC transporter ATP-binding protein